MVNPFRSERDAFRVVVGVALLAAVSVAVGWLADPVYGYALFAAGAAAGLVYVIRAHEPERLQHLREAAAAPHPRAPKDKYRILVVANEALTGAELRREIMRRVELWPELFVIAPALTSRSHYWASDYDHELEEARGRLEATLAWAAEQGFEAAGEVGDPDPLTAIEDALRRFGAEEVIIATHPPAQSSWLESGLVERVREELDVRVTHVVVDLERHMLGVEPEFLGS